MGNKSIYVVLAKGKYGRLLLSLCYLTCTLIPLMACEQSTPVKQAPQQGSSIELELPFDKLVANSDYIVIGSIISQSQSTDNNSGKPITLASLAIDKWLKGNSAINKLIIKLFTVPGNEMDGREGNISFQNGDQILAFLKNNYDGTTSIIGAGGGVVFLSNGQIKNSDSSLEDLILRIKTEINKTAR